MKTDYFKELTRIFFKIKACDDKGKAISLEKALSEVIRLISPRNLKKNKIMLIGNGGSAAIASHITTDFLKNAQIPALSFNDPSLITCLSNDLGYEYVFEKPLEMLAQKGDILFAISSSGESKNILNGALKARQKGCRIFTLSGFARENPLQKMGDVNFYVPSYSYGYVEVAHLTICHCIVDELCKRRSRG